MKARFLVTAFAWSLGSFYKCVGRLLLRLGSPTWKEKNCKQDKEVDTDTQAAEHRRYSIYAFEDNKNVFVSVASQFALPRRTRN